MLHKAFCELETLEQNYVQAVRDCRTRDDGTSIDKFSFHTFYLSLSLSLCRFFISCADKGIEVFGDAYTKVRFVLKYL